MKGQISPLARRILNNPEAAGKLMKILMKEAESNILEFEGKKYAVDNLHGHYSRFYGSAKERNRT